MQVVKTNVNDMYGEALERVLNYGDRVSPRNQDTREIRGATLVLQDPARNLITSKERKLNYTFNVAEWLWMMTGRTDVATLDYFNPNMSHFSDDGSTLNGSYGPKLVEQLPYVVKTLIADRDSRQAVLNIWRERPGASKDIPCTCLMQFFIRGTKLDAVVYMRSNDLWLGFPYDLFNCTMIQGWLAAELTQRRKERIEVGTYYHTVGSLHLYEKNFTQAAAVISEMRMRTMPDLVTPMPDKQNPSLQELQFWFNVFSNEEWCECSEDAQLRLAQLDDTLQHPWNDYFRTMAYRTTKDRDDLGLVWHEAYRRTR